MLRTTFRALDAFAEQRGHRVYRYLFARPTDDAEGRLAAQQKRATA
ncbi:MAG: hypothetical protein ACLSDO_02710 [Anaerotruncus colihominis]